MEKKRKREWNKEKGGIKKGEFKKKKKTKALKRIIEKNNNK